MAEYNKDEAIRQEIMETFDLIRRNCENDNVVYETDDGSMFACNIDELIKKPVNEILDILGLNINSILERASKDPSMFVNDMARTYVISYLIEKMDEIVQFMKNNGIKYQ